VAHLRGVIFDLDGVLVRTDRFHYQAWKELADRLGLPFDEERNHALRGVSREESLRRIYGDRPLPPPEEFRRQCDAKNDRYVELIGHMTPQDVLPGAVELLDALRSAGIRAAIASASRNCRTVLRRTGLDAHCDAVVDGNDATASKPDPAGFLLAAARLGCPPADCVGVEDAESGIEAIHRAGMPAVGIGEQAAGADLTVGGVHELTVGMLQALFEA
jgi:beta-phosphoglucomutase